MTIQRIHYATKIEPLVTTLACGKRGSNIPDRPGVLKGLGAVYMNYTTNAAKVDCQQCIKRMGL